MIQKIKLIEKHLSKNWNTSYLIFQLQEKFNFNEWQFVMLKTILNWSEIARAYSIASTNFESENEWTIHFYIKKASEKWMSNFLTKEINLWEELTMEWPYWKLIDDENTNNYLFITIWSWLAPILALYKQISSQSWKYHKIVNIFWEKNFDDTIEYVNNLIKSSNNNIKYLWFFSRESVQETIKNNIIQQWHVQDWINSALDFLGIQNIKVFLCWNPSMVNDVREILEQKWIAKENIKFEKY